MLRCIILLFCQDNRHTCHINTMHESNCSNEYFIGMSYLLLCGRSLAPNVEADLLNCIICIEQLEIFLIRIIPVYILRHTLRLDCAASLKIHCLVRLKMYIFASFLLFVCLCVCLFCALNIHYRILFAVHLTHYVPIMANKNVIISNSHSCEK